MSYCLFCLISLSIRLQNYNNDLYSPSIYCYFFNIVNKITINKKLKKERMMLKSSFHAVDQLIIEVLCRNSSFSIQGS